MFCIEGPDLAGKSTLAATLRDRWIEYHAPLGFEPEVLVLHKGPPQPDTCPFTEYETALDDPDLLDVILSPINLVILDRWHAGEGAYGPLLRGHSRLTTEGLLHVELSLAALNAYHVVCLPPLEVLQARYEERGDDLVKADYLPVLHAWYTGYAQANDLIVYDGRKVLDEIPDWIMNSSSDDILRANRLQISGARTYIGEPSPTVLLVGDERGPGGKKPRDDLRRPFTPVYPYDASTWLLRAIRAARLHNEVGIINSLEPGVDLPHLYQGLGQPAVIALGNLASRRLTAAEIPHEKISHPQYARRFKHHDFDGYVTQIKKAVALASLERGNRLGALPGPAGRAPAGPRGSASR